jgi:hypothetical protein
MNQIQPKTLTTRKVTVSKAREDFSNIVGNVFYGYQTISLMKGGEEMAIMVNPTIWKDYMSFLQKRVWEVIADVQKRNQNVDPEELKKDIEQALLEVRSKTV